MARELSTQAKNSIFSLYSDGVFLLLLEITHPLIPTLRLVANTEDIISNGETFQAAGFSLKLPNDEEGRVQSAQLRFVNVSRILTPYLRELPDSPELHPFIVLASQPDTIEADYGTFTLRGSEITATTVQGTFAQDSLDNIQHGFRFTPERAPSIFEIQR